MSGGGGCCPAWKKSSEDAEVSVTVSSRSFYEDEERDARKRKKATIHASPTDCNYCIVTDRNEVYGCGLNGLLIAHRAT